MILIFTVSVEKLMQTTHQLSNYFLSFTTLDLKKEEIVPQQAPGDIELEEIDNVGETGIVFMSTLGILRLTTRPSKTETFFIKNLKCWHRGFLNTSSRSRDIQVFEICKLEAYDIIYSQRLIKIHEMWNTSENNRQNMLKLCTCTPMRVGHTTIYSMLLPSRPLGN